VTMAEGPCKGCTCLFGIEGEGEKTGNGNRKPDVPEGARKRTKGGGKNRSWGPTSNSCPLRDYMVLRVWRATQGCFRDCLAKNTGIPGGGKIARGEAVGRGARTATIWLWKAEQTEGRQIEHKKPVEPL